MMHGIWKQGGERDENRREITYIQNMQSNIFVRGSLDEKFYMSEFKCICIYIPGQSAENGIRIAVEKCVISAFEIIFMLEG